MHWLVQLGPFGHVGRFSPASPLTLRRNDLVICRTVRGLEVGRLLSQAAEDFDSSADGQLLRPMSQQDHLLWERIERNRDRAFAACADLIHKRQLSATLMEVESLFDGSSLYFYFLGQVDEQIESLTEELAEAYEAKVKFRRFAEKLAEGCGPDCGTSAAAGACGSSGCSSCGISGVCGTRQAT